MKYYSRLLAVAASSLLISSAGCHLMPQHGLAMQSTSAAPIRKAPAVYAPVPLNLKLCHPNEAGQVPILEYHQLTPDSQQAHNYQYPIGEFRRDMEKLYTLGYRPINLTEFVQGKFDVPAGKSPVVITFDDALPGQVDFGPDGKVVPDCAAGVLLDMHAKHADWPLKGTFFVLPRPGMNDYFYQHESSNQKLQWLVQNGFELGNHTVHHQAGIKHWPAQRVEMEFAVAAKMIDDIVPGYKVDLLALPFGVYPKNEKLVIKGSYNGLSYSNVCALQAGAAPANPSITKGYRPYRVPRIIPGHEDYAIEYWLHFLKQHPQARYISDGDVRTVTVPKRLASAVVPARIQKLGLHLRTY